jgi:type I restriction enzyme M protein
MLRMLKTGGRCAVIVPDGVLFGSSGAHKALRQFMVDDNQLEGVISLPAGAFKPYAGVSTAVLVFAKGGRTNNVFFYDVQRDGYSLDDKRTKLPEKDKDGRSNDDLPDVMEQWKRWAGGRKSALKHFDDRTADAFYVPRGEIADNGYDLSLGRYKQHVYKERETDPPAVILDRLKGIEEQIAADITKLEGMLK